MKIAVVIAGLSVEVHDKVRESSSNLFAPNGKLVLKPIPAAGYDGRYAASIIDEVFQYAKQLPESDELSVMICYVDRHETQTKTFLQNFFPFALTRPLKEIEFNCGSRKSERARVMNQYVDYLARETLALRKLASAVKEKTEVHNLTPLLLPVENFKSEKFKSILLHLFEHIGSSSEPRSLLDRSIQEFLQHHPKLKPPGSELSCFSDGILFFKSPGRHRHGFYRHKKDDGHKAICLLNARCRLGGPYDYTLHYDCSPKRGGLAAHYPNCHGEMTEPKPTHINIAPNDYII